VRRPRRSSPKFVMYFELLQALGEPGCPVCRLREQSSRRALEAILSEQVNDPETRRTLVASRGFCPGHSWMFAEVQGSHLGVALIGRHLLTDALKAVAASPAGLAGRWRRLLGRPAGDRHPHALPAWWRAGKACLLCARGDRAERDCLLVLLDYFLEAELAEGWARSGGLCLPHLCRACEVAPHHPSVPAILAAHGERWAALTAELDEFIRKHDYRFASEPMGAEGGSWARVLEVLAGRRGLPGIERPRIDPRPGTERRQETDKA
jgi:hypothetical protein